MDVRLTPSEREFAVWAQPWLVANTVEANVIATMLDALLSGARHSADALWAVARDGGRVVGAAMHTPPWNLFVGPMPDAAARALAAEFAGVGGRRLDGVGGVSTPARVFALSWARLTGRPVTQVLDQGLFVLDGLEPPRDVAGLARQATADDAARCVAWSDAFSAEALPRSPRPDHRAVVPARIERGLVTLWLDGGTPVSMAARTPPSAGVARIAPVYTLPEHRRRGFGAAVTAAASQAALDDGAQAVMLYTDLANPTSNAIYRAIGYRRVGDAGQWSFGSLSGPGSGPDSDSEAASASKSGS